MDKRFGCWQLRMAWAWYLNHTAARKPRVEDRGLGQGPNVTMQLLANGNVSPGTDLYFDNLFTSFPLLADLSKLSIAGTGTMRRYVRTGCTVHKVPLPDKKKSTNKMKRCDTLSVYKDDQIPLVWRDTEPCCLSWIQ